MSDQKMIPVSSSMKEKLKNLREEMNKERDYYVSFNILLDDLISSYKILDKLGEEKAKEMVKEQGDGSGNEESS